MSNPQRIERITALILAAGMSTRMGQPKMVLPWKDTTIIGQVISTILSTGINNILVVTGGNRQQVEQAIKNFPVASVYNPEFKNGEMAYSIQIGLKALESSIGAAMIVLGDQPQIEAATVRALLEVFALSHSKIVFPSYQMQRGHPWIIDRVLWDSIFEIHPPLTMRNFIDRFKDEIEYVNVSTPTILKDVDTFDDYEQSRTL
jgi:molybdenum cofactor cytidylyltransferase